MGFKTTVDVLILKDLQLRAVDFAARYDPQRPTVVLVPGGMGSRLLKTLDSTDTVPFPDQPRFQKLWLNFGAMLNGDLIGLRMTRDGIDRGNRPVIPWGEVKSGLFKKYDDTEEFFTKPNGGLRANYTVFGYDWRKLPSFGASYLRQYLLFLRDAVAAAGHPDPRPRTTILGHSQGGLVVKRMLNDLADEGENPDTWLERFISIATPFYGTQSHMPRYYVGVGLVNLLSPGGRQAITDLVWTLPGPYILLPAPRTVLEPRLAALGLTRYPVVDAPGATAVADAFESATRGRLPAFMTAEAGGEQFTARQFTSLQLSAAARESRAIDRPLPDAFAGRIFHLRSTLRAPGLPAKPLQIFWQNVDGATFDPTSGADPVSVDDGDSDGTVPLWSARLAQTPDARVFTLHGVRHGGMAENDAALRVVADIMRGNPVQLPATSPPLELADAQEAQALLDEVVSGRRDVESLALERAEVQRRFEEMIGFH